MSAIQSPRVAFSSICASCRHRWLSQTARRAFTTTPRAAAEDDAPPQLSRTPSQRNKTALFGNAGIKDILQADQSSLISANFAQNLSQASQDKAHRFHVYATKHNTHITFVQPAKSASETASSSVSATSGSSTAQKKEIDVLLSVSAGNIGFKKAGRGSYDAAYQLAAYALTTMKEKGMLTGCRSVEVVLRGFGAGREAVTKVLLGSEGRDIRPRITAVVDATRLKQGGPRSRKPRRLG